MHATQGWEYHSDPQIIGSGAFAPTAAEGRDNGRFKNVSPSQRNHLDRSEMIETDGQPVASRQHSSKGKGRATDQAIPLNPEIGPADRSRSRSQRRRDPENEFEGNSDREHQRRLREVRGSRRKKNTNQT